MWFNEYGFCQLINPITNDTLYFVPSKDFEEFEVYNVEEDVLKNEKRIIVIEVSRKRFYKLSHKIDDWLF